MKQILLIFIIPLLISACNSTKPQVSNFETQGNLESPNPANCVPLEGIKTMQNPVDIFAGLAKCLNENKYKNAAEMYLTAMSYGFFDSRRVSDKTSHQSVMVARMNILGGFKQEKLARLQTAIDSIKNSNHSFCTRAHNKGKPDYFPTYMIQHGINAFSGNNDSLVKNFNANTAWKNALKTIAGCD